MLSREQRMVSGDEFRTTIRRGTRSARPTLVTHVVTRPGDDTRVGFVVSKAVGNAVERNRVKRRLRHLMRHRVDQLPPGSRVVVRALPSSSSAGSTDLASDLDAALRKAGAR